MAEPQPTAFVPLAMAVLTVSDTRTEETDKSGKALAKHLVDAGHRLADKAIVPDDIYAVRALVSRWIADQDVAVVVTTGGTGVTGRDRTHEAIQPLLDREIPGFGELFRWISYQEIGTSTVQSRAFAGVANGTLIFCLPGSTGACHTAWNKILQEQLDLRHKPCNFVELMPRMRER